ncbi:CsbD family protein [Lentzea sp. JNUCC 0626]|uniref:CsbD family protein n=1 Tax=Lentzea sp. JNUCC 0626 TaxID=3367513 RepID=UPI00374942EE
MGTDDKFDAKADQFKGKVEEGVGEATGDRSLENEGKKDQAKGHLKESTEKLKDAFKKD